jgi:hypothetical protein
MSQFISVSEAAKLVKKSEVTLYRHIKQGKLSRESSGKIQIAELTRVYGELFEVTENNKSNDSTQNESVNIINLLQQQINDLKHDLSALKAESLERERQALEREERAAKERDRLFNLLDNQPKRTEPKTENTAGGLFSRLFNAK